MTLEMRKGLGMRQSTNHGAAMLERSAHPASGSRGFRVAQFEADFARHLGVPSAFATAN